MITTKIENGMVKVFTPYNKDFVEKVKGIGGRKWNAAEKCWMIPESEIETVRKHMLAVFGETDRADSAEKVAVKVTFKTDECSDYCENFVLFGKTIARGYGRDDKPTVGDDVSVEVGEIKSGGSRKNWYVCVTEGTVIKIRNVTKDALNIPNDYDIVVEEVHEESLDRAMLMDEREKILARLAEIDRLLGLE